MGLDHHALHTRPGHRRVGPGKPRASFRTQRVRRPSRRPGPEKNEARFVYTKRASPSPGFAADVVAPQPRGDFRHCSGGLARCTALKRIESGLYQGLRRRERTRRGEQCGHAHVGPGERKHHERRTVARVELMAGEGPPYDAPASRSRESRISNPQCQIPNPDRGQRLGTPDRPSAAGSCITGMSQRARPPRVHAPARPA